MYSINLSLYCDYFVSIVDFTLYYPVFLFSTYLLTSTHLYDFYKKDFVILSYVHISLGECKKKLQGRNVFKVFFDGNVSGMF